LAKTKPSKPKKLQSNKKPKNKPAVYKKVKFESSESTRPIKPKLEQSNELGQKPDLEIVETNQKQDKEIITEGVTPVHIKSDGYVEFEDKLFQREALKELRPDLFSIKADAGYQSQTNFGSAFPKIATKGDIFVRVDVMPNRVFKFDGSKWIEIAKDKTDTYLYDQEYIKYLVTQIDQGSYDVELLSENEQEQIRNYLNGNQNT
jgi:hypothetical protein